MTKTRASLLALVASSLALAGCGQRFDDSNLEVINKQFDQAEQLRKGGVSPKEVESILGPPKHSETKIVPLETQKKEVELTRYYYEQDGKTIELHFFDNKLISRIPLQNSQPAEKETPAAAPSESSEKTQP